MSPESGLEDRTVAIKLGYGDWQDLTSEERVQVSPLVAMEAEVPEFVDMYCCFYAVPPACPALVGCARKLPP